MLQCFCKDGIMFFLAVASEYRAIVERTRMPYIVHLLASV